MWRARLPRWLRSPCSLGAPRRRRFRTAPRALHLTVHAAAVTHGGSFAHMLACVCSRVSPSVRPQSQAGRFVSHQSAARVVWRRNGGVHAPQRPFAAHDACNARVCRRYAAREPLGRLRSPGARALRGCRLLCKAHTRWSTRCSMSPQRFRRIAPGARAVAVVQHLAPPELHRCRQGAGSRAVRHRHQSTGRAAARRCSCVLTSECTMPHSSAPATKLKASEAPSAAGRIRVAGRHWRA
jgi:hypothetical protein